MRTEIVPFHPEHLGAMIGRFRPADIQELWASSHKSPEEAILDGVSLSISCHTALFDGVPVAVFGVSALSMARGIGSPWMIGTIELDRNAYTIMKHSRPLIHEMFSMFNHLVNYVDARNKKAIRWLKHLGFRFSDPEAHGIEGLPFYRFEQGVLNV